MGNRDNLSRHTKRKTLSAILGILFTFSCVGTASILRPGLGLEKAGRHQEALEWYREAARQGTISQELAEERRSEIYTQQALRQVAEGQAALKANRLDDAFSHMQQAREFAPDLPAVMQYTAAVGEGIVKRAETLASQKNIPEALRQLRTYLDVYPAYVPARKYYDSLLTTRTQDVDELVGDYDKKQLPGNALLAYLSIAQLRSRDPLYLREVQERRSLLFSHFQIPVSFEIGGRSSVGSGVETALATMKFSSPLLLLTSTARPPHSLHLSLNKLDLEYESFEEPQVRIKPIPSGTRSVANPEVASLQELVRSVEQEVMRLGEQIDALHHRLSVVQAGSDRNHILQEIQSLERQHHHKSSDYVDALEKSQSVPQSIEIVNYQEMEYPVEFHRRVAKITFQLIAQSSRTDLPMRVTLELSAEVETSCDVHPAYSELGIPAAPKKFARSDAELRNDALAELAAVVATAADALLKDVMVLERKSAYGQWKDGQAELAGERFVRVLMGTTDGPHQEILDFLASKGIGAIGVDLIRGMTPP